MAKSTGNTMTRMMPDAPRFNEIVREFAASEDLEDSLEMLFELSAALAAFCVLAADKAKDSTDSPLEYLAILTNHASQYVCEIEAENAHVPGSRSKRIH